MYNKYKLLPEDLKVYCDPYIFPYETTKDLKKNRSLIGQDRALEALEYGLSMRRKGYNIFVSGLVGTGKTSYSQIVASEFACKKPVGDDWSYVYNFNRPNSPRAINFKAGKAKDFKNQLERSIARIEEAIPKALGSKDYERARNKIISENKKIVGKILLELNKFAKDYNFIFKNRENGLVAMPLLDGKPMTEEDIDNLSEEALQKLEKDSLKLSEGSYEMINKINETEIKLIEEIEKLTEDRVTLNVKNHIGPIIDNHRENPKLKSFLEDIIQDIVKNYRVFLEEEENYMEKFLTRGDDREALLNKYRVNLFIDNSEEKTAPVLREMNPNYYNLFGKIEYVNDLGVAKTDHTKIKPGSFHRANGGYLIIDAKEILANKLSWEALKRNLSRESIKIENIADPSIAVETLDPEPIPLDIKIIIIGDSLTQQMLYLYDEDFKKLFRIKAEFDLEMNKTEDKILKIGSFVAYQCESENLLPFDRYALASIIDLSSRIAEDKNKLTSRFSELVEIIYEADGWARAEDKELVGREDIEKAIDKKNYRNNLYEEKSDAMIKEGSHMIDIHGERLGVINGLSVIDLGQYAFGIASKITANTYFGKDGVINIEKEVEQSGSIHDKGVLILTGYLGEKYAQDIQLSLTASITFEQSYDGIDGDSASSTELYALLSSLSDIPIKQGIAVTGSVNQKGEIQPVGGVNEKIEGFFRVCKTKGFKGGEGVIIPRQNIDNLMLRDEIIQAVREGIFTIYAVSTIDEGIEILTGIRAGEKDENGLFPAGTVNRAVKDKLIAYAEASEELGE